MDKGKVKLEIVKLSILYLAISPLVLSQIYGLVLFWPDKKIAVDPAITQRIEKQFSLTFQEVTFPAQDGKTLHGWYFKKPNAPYTILFAHGNAGNMMHRLPTTIFLLPLGVSVLLFDYEGYGESQGSPSMEKAVADTVAAFDYLVQKQKIPPTNIILYGESIGGGMACQALKERPAGAIILQSTFYSLFNAIRDRLPWYWLYPPAVCRLEILNNQVVLSQKHPPLLLIHGEKDDVLKFSNARRLYTESPGPKAFLSLPHSGHNEVQPEDMPVYIQGLKNFLCSLKEQPADQQAGSNQANQSAQSVKGSSDGHR